MRTKILTTTLILITLCIGLFLACSSDSDDSGSEDIITAEGDVDITSAVEANYILANDVAISTTDETITISSTGLPEHKTPYWGVDHELYEEFPIFTVEEDNDLYDNPLLDRLWLNDERTLIQYAANANTEMISWSYTMTIPKFPEEAAVKEETELSLIGMALNGVPIYNNYEGGDALLAADAITTFDASGAHPGPSKDYHYHTTGVYTTMDDSNLVGFLRDGFPIYGRQDMDGTYPDDLDENGGHIGVTAQFSAEIYHYHCSNVNYLNSGWYVLKSGAYHGTPGPYTW